MHLPLTKNGVEMGHDTADYGTSYLIVVTVYPGGNTSLFLAAYKLVAVGY